MTSTPAPSPSRFRLHPAVGWLRWSLCAALLSIILARFGFLALYHLVQSPSSVIMLVGSLIPFALLLESFRPRSSNKPPSPDQRA
jgi:hypothetical protein